MKKNSVLFGSLLLSVMVGCQSTDNPKPSSTLNGIWRLVDRQCYCPAAPTPNETLLLTATNFTFYKDGQRVSEGIYAAATGTVCGRAAAIPVLRFTYAATRQFPVDAEATVQGNYPGAKLRRALRCSGRYVSAAAVILLQAAPAAESCFRGTSAATCSALYLRSIYSSSCPMKPIFPRLLLATLLVGGGCKSKTDPQPVIADADALMHATGYWQWESSAARGGQKTPASVGFSRELIFKSDSLIHIFHNRQPALQPAYHLSYGVLTNCNPHPQSIAVPMVRYTAEPQIPNNELRTYSIRLSPTDTTLNIIGEAACFDGGYYETYRWHRH